MTRMRFLPKKMSERVIVSGIYFIRCAANGGVYVGSSVDVASRLKRHFYLLRNGKCTNPILQRTFSKHGASVFTAGMLEFVALRTDLLDREQFWLDSRVGTMNVAKLAYCPPSALGLKRSDETKRKMSEALKGRKQPWAGKIKRSAETRAKMSAAKTGVKLSETHRLNISLSKQGDKHPRFGVVGLANPLFGKQLSVEHREKLSIAGCGRVVSPETRVKMSVAKTGTRWSEESRAKVRGKIITPETRAKISAALKGKPLSPETIAKLVVASTGKTHSPETRAKISQIVTAQWAERKALAALAA